MARVYLCWTASYTSYSDFHRPTNQNAAKHLRWSWTELVFLSGPDATLSVIPKPGPKRPRLLRFSAQGQTWRQAPAQALLRRIRPPLTLLGSLDKQPVISRACSTQPSSASRRGLLAPRRAPQADHTRTLTSSGGDHGRSNRPQPPARRSSSAHDPTACGPSVPAALAPRRSHTGDRSPCRPLKAVSFPRLSVSDTSVTHHRKESINYKQIADRP